MVKRLPLIVIKYHGMIIWFPDNWNFQLECELQLLNSKDNKSYKNYRHQKDVSSRITRSKSKPSNALNEFYNFDNFRIGII